MPACGRFRKAIAMPVECPGTAATHDPARRVPAEQERAARARGERRIRWTTGPRRPEAGGLHLATGCTPRLDTAAGPEGIGPLPLEEHLAITSHPGKATDL
ncbi:hypothetical protein GCM10010451_27990 [Streptomyces virens]|jgi:hypothetical protein|uniref:Uncharacterized protein n=1 Tax=Streptomyces virens TaxID=285572 RepID=A0ABP6PGB4_9ACTN|nr:hypothetical protein GCM10010247_58120 [Streptomyces calvus]